MLDTLGFRRRLAMCHSGGVVQGGFVAAWIDSAMAHALFSLGLPDVAPVTMELKVSYFAPVRPGPVIAGGWIERRGKSTAFAEGLLRNEVGEILAKASSTLRLVSHARVVEGSRAAVAGG